MREDHAEVLARKLRFQNAMMYDQEESKSMYEKLVICIRVASRIRRWMLIAHPSLSKIGKCEGIRYLSSNHSRGADPPAQAHKRGYSLVSGISMRKRTQTSPVS